MKPEDLNPGPIRHPELSPEFLLRIDAVRATLSEVCALSAEEWQDAFKRDRDPEHEISWWERVATCYVALVELRTFSIVQRQAAFNIIFGLFSGLGATQMQPDLAKLPDSAMDYLAAIVAQLGRVN